MNEKIKQICRDFDGYLHCSASGEAIDWHALQCRQDMSAEAGLYEQEMRSAAGHATAEEAVAACLALEWRKVERSKEELK